MILDQTPTPLYFQLQSIFETKIYSQEWKENECVPSEAELCKEFNVSRATVRQALGALTRAGLIYRDRGKGTFVAEGAGLKRPMLQGSIQDLVAASEGTRIKILSYREIAMPAELAKIPKLWKTDKVYQLELVRLIAKGPIGYTLVYVSPGLGKKILHEELVETIEIITFLEEKLMTRAHRAVQTIDVMVADQFHEKMLSVQPNTPLLVIQRVYYTREGSLMFIAKSSFRPDRFKYRIELART